MPKLFMFAFYAHYWDGRDANPERCTATLLVAAENKTEAELWFKECLDHAAENYGLPSAHVETVRAALKYRGQICRTPQSTSFAIPGVIYFDCDKAEDWPEEDDDTDDTQRLYDYI